MWGASAPLFFLGGNNLDNDIKRESLIESNEKLLYDVRELLSEIRNILKPTIGTNTEIKAVIENKSTKNKKG